MGTSFTQGTLSLIILQAISIHLPCVTRDSFVLYFPHGYQSKASTG